MEKLEEAGLEKAPTEKKRKAREPEQSAQPKSVTFPMNATINAYGFLHFNNEMRQAFGIPQGKKVEETPITIDFKDGALIIRKV